MIVQLPPNPIIALDYDGTCVGHSDSFPTPGPDIGAVPWLKAWVSARARLLLWTVRAGEELKPAVAWFKEKSITLWAVNENPDQAAWSKSPKAHAHLFVDELAFGAPLVQAGKRPHLQWGVVGPTVLAALMKHKK